MLLFTRVCRLRTRQWSVCFRIVLLQVVALFLIHMSHGQQEDIFDGLNNFTSVPNSSVQQSIAPSPAVTRRNITTASNAPSIEQVNGEKSIGPSNQPSPSVEAQQPSTIPTSSPFTIVDDKDRGSDFPSLIPTRDDDSASDSPSDIPSDMPSSFFSTTTVPPTLQVQPTPKPSKSKVILTASPTTNVSTDGIPISVRFFGMSMILKGIGTLSNEATEIWVNVTTNFYEMVHNTVHGTSINNATTTNNNASSRQRQRQRRYLHTYGIVDFNNIITYTTQRAVVAQDDDNSNNTISYFQQVNYTQTSDSAPSAAELIQDPFYDKALNRLYVDTLRASHDAFSNLQYNVSVPTIPTPTGTLPSNPGDSDDDDDTGLSTVIIAGIVIGSVFLLALVFLACQYVSSSKNNYYNHHGRRESTTSGNGGGGGGSGDHGSTSSAGRRPVGGDESSSTTSSRIPGDDFHDDDDNNNNQRTNRPKNCNRRPQRQSSENENIYVVDDDSEEKSEIESINVSDDHVGGAHHQQQQQQQKQQQQRQKKQQLQQQRVGQSNTGEDRDTAGLHPKLGENEELLVIEAPAGWLGVVIDTPDQDQPPVVHDIKESSAIFGILQLGDRLIAVDDVDVTHLTATQASKVLSSKAANSVRRLRVIRSKHVDIELV